MKVMVELSCDEVVLLLDTVKQHRRCVRSSGGSHFRNYEDALESGDRERADRLWEAFQRTEREEDALLNLQKALLAPLESVAE